MRIFDSFLWYPRHRTLKNLSDKKGWIIVLDAQIDGFDFLLTNIYNAKAEKEQVNVVNELTTILSNFENTDNHVIIAGDFIIFFDASLDVKGGTPTLKVGILINWPNLTNACLKWYMENKKP